LQTAEIGFTSLLPPEYLSSARQVTRPGYRSHRLKVAGDLTQTAPVME
jgi:hypothetical protein